jgi:hypothetical protein
MTIEFKSKDKMRGFFPFPFDCAQGQGQNDKLVCITIEGMDGE